MTPAFTANGYEQHRSMDPFVVIFPTFPTGPGVAFVSCDLHMSPSDARHLAAELLQAADIAEDVRPGLDRVPIGAIVAVHEAMKEPKP